MQQLTAPPAMSSPTPSMTSGVPYSPPPQPRLGTPIPGTTGGLPALSGLSVYQNPMAQQLQSMGRGDDKMLVHMTPREVQSLRGLAQLTGGDLTTNPNTGLPEAGWLGNLLPTIFGVLGSMVGLPTWAIGLGGLGVGTAATGSLTKGLMTGLQAFGGAGLGNAVGLGGKISSNAFGLTGGSVPVPAGAPPAVAPPAPVAVPDVAATNLSATAGATAGTTAPALQIAQGPLVANPAGIATQLGGIGPSTFSAPINTGAPGATGLLGKFKEATNITPLGKLGATVGPYAAGLGLLSGVSSAFEKKPPKDEEEKTNFPYKGPYMAKREQYAPMPIDLRGPNPSAQRSYFGGYKFLDAQGNEFIPGTPTKEPVPYYAAKGGELGMDEGSFIFPARETAELGNGSSRAGQEVLARMGGRPIDGKGDGVSDSIPARIGGKQEARVARDEVYFSPQAVARIGGGDHNRGTKKLYALMDKASKARKRAAVGADTKLRRGIV